MINSWQSFMSAVAIMREAQKTYFRTRSSGDLAAAKRLETEVDEAIKNHTAKTKPGQTELSFDQTPAGSRPGLPYSRFCRMAAK